MPEGGAGWEGGQTYVVYASHPDSGYLKHVYNVLERAGQSLLYILFCQLGIQHLKSRAIRDF
jgi:hypothetical protein